MFYIGPLCNLSGRSKCQSVQSDKKSSEAQKRKLVLRTQLLRETFKRREE